MPRRQIANGCFSDAISWIAAWQRPRIRRFFGFAAQGALGSLVVTSTPGDSLRGCASLSSVAIHESGRQSARAAGPPTVSVGSVIVTQVDSKSILTPTSGFMSGYKFSLNPYRGCAFGCEYCYARFFAPTAAERETWGWWVMVKRNAVQLMAKACRSGLLGSGDTVYMSSVTDPYQPIERRLGLSRAVLATILEHGVQPRLTIQTRSPIVSRDIDLFRRFDKLRVNLTISTDSEDVRRRYEPRCPSIEVRFKTASALASAGIRIGVSVSPMLPIRHIEAFGARLAALDAAEYVTQYFKPGSSRFAAGTTVAARAKAREDRWGIEEYRQAREQLRRMLGERRPLLEGAEGYAPA